MLHSKTVIKATDHDQLTNDCSKIKILNTTSKSYKIYYIKNEVFHCSTLYIDQKFDQRLAKSHLPRQYLDIALEAGQYKIYCPAKAFYLPTQSVKYV